MESGAIRDADITASSAYDSGSVGPQHSRYAESLPAIFIRFTRARRSPIAGRCFATSRWLKFIS